VVPPDERPAASSLTNVPRSLAACLSPLLTGSMLAASSFGWPLVCGGLAKAVYDLLLLRLFGRSTPASGPHPSLRAPKTGPAEKSDGA
jgi:hypothetical protein